MKSWFNINEWIISNSGFTNAVWAIVFGVLFILLSLFFFAALRGGRVKGRQMLTEAGWTALWYYGAVLLSFLVYWPFGDKTPLLKPANMALVWICAAIVITFIYVMYFRKRKKHFSDQVSSTAIRKSAAGSGASKYCYALLYAGMLVSSFISILRVVSGDSIIHLLFPMLTVVLALLLYGLTHWRFWYLFASLLILVYVVLMIQNVLAATSFAYAPVIAMIPLFLSAILPLCSLALIKLK